MSIADHVKSDLRRILSRRGEIRVRIAGAALPSPQNASIVDSGAGVATVTAAAHGFTTGNSVVMFGSYEPRFNGTFTISVTSVNEFTFAVSGTTAGSATGAPRAVLDSELLAADRFYSFGHIRDSDVESTPVETSASTTGKKSQIATDYVIKATLMQTGDAEFLSLDDLANNPIDVTVFGSACPAIHTQKGALVADLQDGFLVYDALISFGGKIDLTGGESGITVSIPFRLGKSSDQLAIGV